MCYPDYSRPEPPPPDPSAAEPTAEPSCTQNTITVRAQPQPQPQVSRVFKIKWNTFLKTCTNTNKINIVHLYKTHTISIMYLKLLISVDASYSHWQVPDSSSRYYSPFSLQNVSSLVRFVGCRVWTACGQPSIEFDVQAQGLGWPFKNIVSVCQWILW